ncbi:MAG: site-specific integrase [Clostridiales bacterium]|nr:site-specific integrase [Clostridiales bacterium]
MKVERYKVRGETKYRFRAYLGTDPVTGKEIRIKQSGFDTRKEAQLACAEMVAKSKPSQNAKNITYRQLYEVWLESYRLEVKESTLKHTEQVFRDHILPYFGDMKIRDVTPLHCQQWTTEQAKKASDNKRHIYMSKIFDFAVRQGVIDKNPAAFVDRPRKVKSARHSSLEMKVYTKDELKRFLKLCNERLPHQWAVFFRLLAYTGMRRGEALVLTWDDLDEKSHTIRICKTVTHGEGGAYISDTPKTDKSNRTIYIDDETLHQIQTLPRDYDYIFPNTKGSYTTPSMVVKMMHKAVDGSDLRYISPHGLRHTHCSLLFSAGVSIPEVQDRLGHADVKTTIDVYNHVYQSDKTAALDRFVTFMGE